jgi:hypothetical protein
MNKLINKIPVEAFNSYQLLEEEVHSNPLPARRFEAGETWTVKGVTENTVLLKAKGEKQLRCFEPEIIKFAFYGVSDDE